MIQQQTLLQQQKLALRQAEFELKLQGRIERKQNQVRKATIKSRLIDVYVIIDPLDYENVVLMIWAFASQRDPLLRREDVTTGRELKDFSLCHALFS